MRFEYEVGIDEYMSGSLLYWKLIDSRSRLERGLFWTLAGVSLIVLAWASNPLLRSVVMTTVGVWWIYEFGLRNLFPQSYLSRQYADADIAGRKFTTEISEHGFEITMDSWGWHVPWQGVRLKAEDERVFMVYSFGTMFIFGKKYLSQEQQQELRKFLTL